MTWPRPRVRSHALAVLGLLTMIVVALGSIVAHDVLRFDDDARQLYEHLSDGLNLVDKLQFETQEVRRILLYALHTANANRQLEYADQSRAAEARVERLLADRLDRRFGVGTRERLDDIDRAWKRYLLVRDEVIGLILEGSLPEGVALDEQRGNALFNEVRQKIENLNAHLESDAAIQVSDAEARANRAIARLVLLVATAVCAAAFGVYLVNRRAALEALLRSEAHKGSILQAVPNPIISTDAGGHIVELNDAAERSFGVTRAIALGARMDEVVLPLEARGMFSALLAGNVEISPAGMPRIETLGMRRDGTTFPMELAAVSHTVGRDRIWTVHLFDLTERYRMEEQLRHAKEAEVATQAKSDFLATISHELRTPLSGVIGLVELLHSADGDVPQPELIRMLRSAATALFGVVNDFLDYAKIEAGLTGLNPVTFSIQQCIEGSLELLTEPAARKKLEIGYVIDPDVPAIVVADQDRVRQVLLNLLSNAVKFTDIGEVAVHVGAVGGPYDSVAISIAVRDTGCGIPANLHEKLFQRFSQVDTVLTRRHSGAGLGLPISHSLSRLLGGSLTVESHEGRGSTFTLVFNARVPSGHARTDTFRGSLTGVRVFALLGSGIVGRQVRLLLEQFDVRLFSPSDDERFSVPVAERFDVVVVDAESVDRSIRLAVLGEQFLSRFTDLPRIVITRFGAARPATGRTIDSVLSAPVRVQALYEAISTALGMVPHTLQVPVMKSEHRVIGSRADKVLLVEDNDANRRVVRLMLEELGIEVDEVASGLDAVARAGSHRYDVILMDVRMPDCDGLEATRRIRANGNGDPPVIIALTANVMRGEEERCREAGMDGYLPKPLRLNTLAAALDRLVALRKPT